MNTGETFNPTDGKSIRGWLADQGIEFVGPDYLDPQKRGADGVYDANLDKIELDDIKVNLNALLTVFKAAFEDKSEFRKFYWAPLRYINSKYNVVTGRQPGVDLALLNLEVNLGEQNTPEDALAQLEDAFKQFIQEISEPKQEG